MRVFSFFKYIKLKQFIKPFKLQFLKHINSSISGSVLFQYNELILAKNPHYVFTPSSGCVMHETLTSESVLRRSLIHCSYKAVKLIHGGTCLILLMIPLHHMKTQYEQVNKV